LASRQILFANLHPIHARVNRARDGGVKSGGFDSGSVGDVEESKSWKHVG